MFKDRNIKRVRMSRYSPSVLVDAGPKPRGPKWVIVLVDIVAVVIIGGLLIWLCGTGPSY